MREDAAVMIRQMQERDVEKLWATFTRWQKPREKYQRYFVEQQRGERVILVAFDGENIVGYATLVWQSGYEPFKRQEIPEIVDLSVITDHQRQGIGTLLVRAAEEIAIQHSRPIIGISVEQVGTHIAANKLYPKLGYVPDGNGITPRDNELHLTKQL
jgi:ribosomal protein S18 acetylase RimI-like enzyme